MEQAVINYINAYNNFDIEGMLKDLDEQVIFENSSNGEINLIVTGIAHFKAQAIHAATYFTVRHQEILEMETTENQVTVKIKYTAVLAKDLAENLTKGDEMSLLGSSIFYFKDNKIIKIVDAN